MTQLAIKFDLEPGLSRIAFEDGSACPVAIGVGKFPTADHPLGGFAECRRLREGNTGNTDRRKTNRKTGHNQTIAPALAGLRD